MSWSESSSTLESSKPSRYIPLISNTNAVYRYLSQISVLVLLLASIPSHCQGKQRAFPLSKVFRLRFHWQQGFSLNRGSLVLGIAVYLRLFSKHQSYVSLALYFRENSVHLNHQDFASRKISKGILWQISSSCAFLAVWCRIPGLGQAKNQTCHLVRQDPLIFHPFSFSFFSTTSVWHLRPQPSLYADLHRASS